MNEQLLKTSSTDMFYPLGENSENPSNPAPPPPPPPPPPTAPLYVRGLRKCLAASQNERALPVKECTVTVSIWEE